MKENQISQYEATYKKQIKQTILAFAMLIGVGLCFYIMPGKQVAAATFSGGDGSKSNPYKVTNASQLNEVRNYSGKYFILLNDIDLASDRKTREWQPITKFSGNIDGKGYSIKNLRVDQPGSKAGFAANGANATIQNIMFENVDILGKYAGAVFGALHGQSYNGETVTVNNCRVTGVIQGSEVAGGIVGESKITATIRNCTVEANITGETTDDHSRRTLGGISGELGVGAITNCKFMGTITQPKCYFINAGGIVGYLGQTGETVAVEQCEVDAKITVYADGGGDVGGIAGAAIEGRIKDCTVKGEVSSTTSIGGIIGSSMNTMDRVTIENCINYADITGENKYGGYVAGIVGHLFFSDVSNCTNYGKVNGNCYAGGIVGLSEYSSTIKNSTNYGKIREALNDGSAGGILGYAQDAYHNYPSNYTQVINCISYEAAEGTSAGSIAGTIGTYSTISSCYYVQDQVGVAKGNSGGTIRIGEIGNPVLKLGEAQSILSKYPRQVVITPVSSNDTSIVAINDNKLVGVGIGQTEITFEVILENNKEQLTYTLEQEVKVTENGVFAGGEGTVENPYIIKTAEQLQLVASYPNAHYRLEDDIELYSVNSFTPIGSYESPFTGSFDGNEYIIKGLTVSKYNRTAGLFGVAINATITGVYLEDAYITTGQYAGGVVGYANQSQITDCIVNGEISATSVANNHSGLIVGYMEGGSLKNCCGVGEVKAAYAGVFAGYINITPINCYWYTPYTTQGVAQGTSQSINAVKKIDLGIDTLKVGEGVAGNVKVKAVQPITNFNLYGTPISYSYTSTTNTNVVKINKNELVPVEAGTANIKLTVTFKNGKKVPFDYKITVKKSIENTTISSIKTQVFGNRNICPVVTVMDGKTKLTSKDYKVSYTNNKYPGTAVITITGTGSYSGTKKVNFTIALPKVSAVKSVNKTDQVKLSWKKENAVDGYEIYLYSTKKTITVKTNSYTQSKLKAATSYKYKIRAYKVVNNKKVYGAYSDVITATTKPAIPKIKLTTRTKEVKVSWNKVSNTSGYEVYMATSKNGKYTRIQDVKKNSTTSYTKKKLKSKQTYYFKVRSFKTVSGSRVYSDYSIVNKIKVK